MNLKIEHLTKRFGEKLILNDLTLTFRDHGVYCLMAPSGSGKTTLFRILTGLEEKDRGEISGITPGSTGVHFQEDRLIPFLNPAENLALVCPKTTPYAVLEESLKEILPEDCLTQPCSELSGGMKRRVSLARSLWYPSNCILMDEPFTGLDETTKENVITYVLKMRKDRTLIVATHSEEEAAALYGEILHLPVVIPSDEEGTTVSGESN